MTFPNIHPALERAITAQGYKELTPVQSAVMADEAADKDLLVSAQTGSGKTVAYGLAFASTLLGLEQSLDRPGPPLALIIAPTRELAMQVNRELTWLYAAAGAQIVSCVGGMDARREQRALGLGAHIVVGTPGRLRDHLERGNLDLSALRVVVLDEADEMLDLGFREDLEEILDGTPEDRRTLLFSATIAKDIATLARKFQKNAVRIDTVSRDEPHGDIEYRAIRVAPNEIERAVVNVLRFYEAPGALVFCATRESVRHLHGALRERGFSVVSLSGELSQKERMDALQALRDGRAKVCVATDVAARGLDLPDLGLVIHAELPANKAGLLHRSGRTGRAGRKGVSVLLTPYTRRRRVEGLLASANIEAEWSGPPSAEEIRAKDQARWLADPALVEPPTEDETPLVEALMGAKSALEIATALVRLNRSALPEPEEVFDDARMRQAQERDPPRGPDSGWRPDRPDRPERPDRLAPDQATWFRVTVGRQKNADPKWLIPLICRLGHVTKPDIGQIRIFDRETKFEISKEVEAKFTAAIAATVDDEIRIEPAGAPGPRDGPGPRRPQGGPGGGYKGDKPKGEFKPRSTYKPRMDDADGGRPPRGDFKPRPEYGDRPKPDFKPKADFKPRADRPTGEIRPRAASDGKPPFKGKGGYKGKSDFKGKGDFKPKAPYKGKADKGTFKGPRREG